MKKAGKKTASLVLALMLAVGCLVAAPVTVGAVEIATPDALAVDNTGNAPAGSRVYFGEYNGTPIEWRVLENANGQALLFSQNILGANRAFNTVNSVWSTSTLRTWMNDADAGLLPQFPSEITGAMVDTDTTEQSVSSQDKLYLLNYTEVTATYAANIDMAAGENWWLRSQGTNGAGYVHLVAWNGSLDATGFYSGGSGWVRPAFSMGENISYTSGDGSIGTPYVVGTGTATDLAVGKYIRFQVNDTDTDWKVIGASGGNVTLLCTTALENRAFDENADLWAASGIREFLNPAVSYEPGTFAFDAAELGAVAVTDIAEKETPTQDRLFLLSETEARNSAYFTNDSARATSAHWWLRSPAYNSGYVASVWNPGLVVSDGDARRTLGIRPAFNLNLASVLFTSAAAGGKPTCGGPSLSAAEPPTGAVKLTVLDDANLCLNTTVTAISAQSDATVNIPYTGAQTGAGRSVSVAVCNKTTGAVLFYGRPVDCATTNANGTASFTLPNSTDLPAGEYTLRVFNEEVNSANQTDYASTPKDIALTVDNTKPTVSSVSPSGSGIATTTGTLSVTFDDAMDTTTSGTVSLSGGGAAPGLSNPQWSNGDKTISYTLSGLAYGATYTYNISGFKNAAGLTMDAVTSGHSFTTVGQPTLTATPTSLAFGNQATGTTSAGQTVTVSGGDLTGNITYSIGGTNAADFAVAQTSWNAASGGTLTVTFMPSATGARSATLTIQSTGAADKTVALTGTGITPPPPTLAVSPANLAFGPQEVNTTGTAKTVTVTGTSLTGDIVVGTPTNAAYTVTKAGNWNNRTGGTLEVSFKPTATGNHDASFTISGTGATTQTVTLAGEGVNAPTADSGQNTFAVAGGTTQTAGKAFTITATGHRQNVAAGAAIGETRYIPVSASANPTVSLTLQNGAYSGQMTIANAGTYILTLTYRLERWNGSQWTDTGATDIKTGSLTVLAAASSSNPPASSSTPPAASGSPQTGDDSNVGQWVALLCASLAALGAGVWVLVRRRKRKMD